MRIFILSFALIAAAGCAERRHVINVTPDRPSPDRTASNAAPADSLSTYMAKFREMAAHARPEGKPAFRTVEAADPALAAALFAATAAPSPETFRNAAQEYHRLGVDDQALDYLTRALKFDSKDAQTHDALARVWRDAGFPHLGLGDAYRAIYYAPRSAAARNTLGTLFQAMGRRAEARAEYQRAIQLDPLAAYAYSNLCYGWVLEHDASRAVNSCRQALSLDPTSAVALNNAGLAYALAGDLAASRESFAKAGSRATAAFNSGLVDLALKKGGAQ